MATRREIVEGILFLPAMALLAAVIGGGLYLVIRFGGFALKAIYGLLHAGIGLPHSAALALAVLLAALVVYATVPRIMGWIGTGLNRLFP